MVRAREGEEEAFLIQQPKGPKVEILISLRCTWKMSLLFGKGRRIENHDIIPGFNASHDIKHVSSNQSMGDFLQLI
jgi:hypothetical protein